VSKTLTLQALAELVKGKITHGESTTPIQGLNSLSDAQPGDVSFLGNPKYAAQVAKTAATAILVSPDFSDFIEGKAFIAVENPTFAFSAVISHFVPESKPRPPGIHPTAFVAEDAQLNPEHVHVGPHAIIESGAQVGDGCIIHAGAYIGPEAVLGPDCVLHPTAVVKDRCLLGARVIIHSASVIGSDGFGYEFVKGQHVKIDQVGIVEIGDDVEVGSCTSIDRARFGRTVIGKGTKIDNQVQIAHNVVIGQHCVLVSQVGISGSTHLGNYVIMGGQSGAAGHLKIGDQVTLLGRAGAIKDLPGPGHYTGFPARPLHEGRRLMVAPALVPALQKKIKDLEQRLAQLEAKLP
jgi:UDP-3-O-[3-hydroxymyristoyl] glucosamine N-acyltransferase